MYHRLSNFMTRQLVELIINENKESSIVITAAYTLILSEKKALTTSQISDMTAMTTCHIFLMISKNKSRGSKLKEKE